MVSTDPWGLSTDAVGGQKTLILADAREETLAEGALVMFTETPKRASLAEPTMLPSPAR